MTFPDAVLELVAERMRLLSDPLRIRLLLVLDDGEASVQEVADALDTAHCNASRALKALHRDGLLSRRCEGSRALYAIADYTALRLISQAAAGLAAHVDELNDLIVTA